MSAAFLSVVVTTYNRPDALGAVLDALARQQDAGGFEVLVADDGSGAETRALIARFQQRFPVALHHVWQEDDGFRAAAARNAAVARSRGRYLLFLDGDCVPLPDFCARHRRLMEPGWCVAGNRILLAEAFTRQLLASERPADVVDWDLAAWQAATARGDANKATALRRWSLGPLRKLGARRWQRVRTCNLGVWRQDFLAVDGFDESFTGWGYEDSDFAVRLMRHGVRIKDGRFAVPVLHLWHRENDRRNEPENRARLNETLKSSHIRARAGLSAHPAT
ncbi:glycosyltransferase [Uliginosibacterium sp. H1]|uniref:glycosyltransferase n=1 Tax=Uliginosibacterium sp. H1 TaxID=3114757 RepID=UPI002E1786B5|nr:glycosyltransferase [Uliginosibacterium sp. H1]